jgi:hypothetical protein
MGRVGQVAPVSSADSGDEQCEDSETYDAKKRHAG